MSQKASSYNRSKTYSLTETTGRLSAIPVAVSLAMYRLTR